VGRGDRIEALALQEGVLDALRKTGWIVDVDDSRADEGIVRWLLWVKDVCKLRGDRGGDAAGLSGRAEGRGPFFPRTIRRRGNGSNGCGGNAAPIRSLRGGNVLERLLETAPKEELLAALDGSGTREADQVLLFWTMLLFWTGRSRRARVGDRGAAERSARRVAPDGGTYSAAGLGPRRTRTRSTAASPGSGLIWKNGGLTRRRARTA